MRARIFATVFGLIRLAVSISLLSFFDNATSNSLADAFIVHKRYLQR